MDQFATKAEEYLQLKHVPAFFSDIDFDDGISPHPTDQTFLQVEAATLVRVHAREEANSIPTILNNLEYAAAFLCTLLNVR